MLDRVLVFQIGLLGDLLVSLPALRYVKASLPDTCELHMLHSTGSDIEFDPIDLLENQGLVDKIIRYTKINNNPFMARINLIKQIRKEKYREVYSILPSKRTFSQLIRDRFFFRLCGIKKIRGFFLCDPLKGGAEVELRLLRLCGGNSKDPTMQGYFRVPMLSVDNARKTRVTNIIGDCIGRRIIAICPGSNMPSKLWNLNNFRDLGEKLISEGFYLLVVGGLLEKDLGDRLVTDWGAGTNVAGSLDFLESAEIMSKCSIVVTLDSGSMHLAAAMGVPCVALFSGRDIKGLWNPIGTSHEIIRKDVPCSGCMAFDCSVAGHPCMSMITVAEVLSKIKNITISGKC